MSPTNTHKITTTTKKFNKQTVIASLSEIHGRNRDTHTQNIYLRNTNRKNILP